MNVYGPPEVEANKVSAPFIEDNSQAGSMFSSGEVELTVIIFIFGLIALAGFCFLVWSGRATPFLMRIYVVIILVFGTLLVVSSAYGTEQIVPVVGFFGTIAGYLLGRTERRSGERDQDDAGGTQGMNP